MDNTMSVSNNTLYIKGDQSVEVTKRDVTLGDLVTMECSQQNIVSKLKTMKVLKIPEKGQHRFVVSILKIIELIHKEYPNLEVQSYGSPDVIVTYENQQQNNRLWQICKIAFVTLTTFLGSAFAIATFNNDSGIPQLFDDIYKLFMGVQKEGFSILELSYSVGIVIGILVFFNHFGKKKLSVDPTPIEVEMRLYENDIQTTVIAEYGRKGQELDVGTTNSIGNTRS
jgi:stage V sporulation protein AA